MKECQRRMIEEAEFVVSERHESNGYIHKMFMYCKETNNEFVLYHHGNSREIPITEMRKLAEERVESACETLYNTKLKITQTEV